MLKSHAKVQRLQLLESNTGKMGRPDSPEFCHLSVGIAAFIDFRQDTI